LRSTVKRTLKRPVREGRSALWFTKAIVKNPYQTRTARGGKDTALSRNDWNRPDAPRQDQNRKTAREGARKWRGSQPVKKVRKREKRTKRRASKLTFFYPQKKRGEIARALFQGE